LHKSKQGAIAEGIAPLKQLLVSLKALGSEFVGGELHYCGPAAPFKNVPDVFVLTPSQGFGSGDSEPSCPAFRRAQGVKQA